MSAKKYREDGLETNIILHKAEGTKMSHSLCLIVIVAVWYCRSIQEYYRMEKEAICF